MNDFHSAPWQARQQLLIGEEGCRKLHDAVVAVVGLGGVGGAVTEALARAGVGNLILMDHDTVDLTNLNRQLLATLGTVDMPKTEAAARRILSINPLCSVTKLTAFYAPETASMLFSEHPCYIADCIDTVTAKVHMAVQCASQGIPEVICLGTGNRFDPSAFRIGDIAETARTGAGDGLARVMRKKLKENNIYKAEVLYSIEPAAKVVVPDSENGRHAPGSISFCPPAAGFIIAGHIIRRILELS